jgi:hypothetical protein
MPNGALCSPKRLLMLLSLAALRVAVGPIGFGSCLIKIGSGASAPLRNQGFIHTTVFESPPRLQRMVSENLLVQEKARYPEEAERSHPEFAHLVVWRFLATG